MNQAHMTRNSSFYVKVNIPCKGLVSVAGVWDAQYLRISGTWRWKDFQLYASAAFTPRKDTLLLISVSGRIYDKAVERMKKKKQKRISMTPLFLFPLLSDIIIIIFINCNWVITRWQWLFYMYTNMR
jgi:hypothetical protein